jgi:hypothetical protein
MNKKAMRLSLAALAGLLVFASELGAASTWEGSAVIGGLEDFPSDDLFGACNSFPVNSSVEVENLENGKKVSVIISQTIDNPAVFMALSPRAAATLGMRRGAASRVRILAAPAVSTSAPRPAVAPGASVDPDYNPSILAYAKPSAEKGDSARGAELSGLLGPASKGAEGAGASADIATVAAPEEEPPVVALPEARVPEAPALVEPSPTVPASEEKAAEVMATEPAAPGLAIEPAAAAENPEKAENAAPEMVEAPSTETGKSVEVAVAEPEPAAEAAEPAEESVPPEPLAIAAAETAETAESAAPQPAEAAAVATAEPEVASESEAAEEREADVVLSLEPTSPRPPVAEAQIALSAPESAADKIAPAAVAPIAPQPAAAVVPAPAAQIAAQPASLARAGHPAQDPAGVPRIEALAKGSYYVQIGVFATDEALKASVAALSSGKYPIAYERLEGRGPTAQYRLYVGPIARDESGLTLKKIKGMGYGDAFLKKGK